MHPPCPSRPPPRRERRAGGAPEALLLCPWGRVDKRPWFLQQNRTLRDMAKVVTSVQICRPSGGEQTRGDLPGQQRDGSQEQLQPEGWTHEWTLFLKWVIHRNSFPRSARHGVFLLDWAPSCCMQSLLVPSGGGGVKDKAHPSNLLLPRAKCSHN